jgi:hypothetical protein
MVGLVNKSTFKPGLKTYLYLVKLGDFYKIGVTQRDIYIRFKQRGLNCITIDYIELDNYKQALEMEKSIVNKMTKYRVGRVIAEGYTECFSYPEEIKSLAQLFSTKIV